ncbi:extracellular solute-binding protein [Ruminococcaceae bacterium OttesenSCG-928-L11]|nr:extracellular solute-binding protein [Ruminococcaceae bacterium OttesenSCG-928-L11]
MNTAVKKCIALFLAIVATANLAACGSDPGSSVPDVESSHSVASSETPSSQAQSETETAPSLPDKPVDVEGMVHISTAVLPDKADNFVEETIREKIKVNLNLTTYGTMEDLQTNLNLRLMSGDAPDFFVVNGRTNLSTYVQEGFLLNLGDYEDRMPNVFAFMGNAKASGMIDGQQYAIAKRPYGFRNGLWIRKDWLDAHGLPIPTTLEDYINAIRIIAASDPDGNGHNDTIGLTGIGLDTMSQFYGAYGVGNHKALVLEPDGSISSPLYEPAFREALTLIKSLIEEGLIDKEFLASNNNILSDKFIQGSAVSFFSAWSALLKPAVFDPMLENNPGAEWIMLDGLQGPYDNYAGQYDDISNSGLYSFSSLLEGNQEKTEAVCRLFDYLAHGEGLDLAQFGIEDVHFTKDANGNYNTIEGTGSQTDFTFIYQLVGRDELPYCQVKFAYAYEEAAFAYNRKRVSTINSIVQNPEWYKAADANRYIEEEITKFIFGNRSLDEYDSFLEVLNSTYQYDKFVQDAQTQYKQLISD